MALIDEGTAWKATGMLSGVLAGMLTRRILVLGWKAVRGSDPPANPASRRTTWPEALFWAAASGVAIAVGRLVAERGAAGAWKAATGSYPKDLEAV